MVIAREIGDRHGEGNALGNLGNTYSDLGDVRCAIEFYEQAMALHESIGDASGSANDSSNLAVLLAQLGRSNEALPHAERAATFYEVSGHSENASQVRDLAKQLRNAWMPYSLRPVVLLQRFCSLVTVFVRSIVKHLRT